MTCFYSVFWLTVEENLKLPFDCGFQPHTSPFLPEVWIYHLMHSCTWRELCFYFVFMFVPKMLLCYFTLLFLRQATGKDGFINATTESRVTGFKYQYILFSFFVFLRHWQWILWVHHSPPVWLRCIQLLLRLLLVVVLLLILPVSRLLLVKSDLQRQQKVIKNSLVISIKSNDIISSKCEPSYNSMHCLGRVLK